jgi:hypothetical protein
MATQPQFQMAKMARRQSSDLERLAKAYQDQVGNISGNLQTAFTGYKAKAAETNAPYEKQMETYRNTLLPTYESQAAAYQQGLDKYNATLAEIAKNPTIKKTGTREVKTPRWGLWGLAGYDTRQENYTYYEPKPIPTFTEKRPVTPDIPVAPTIAAFDDAPFKQQLGQAEQNYQGEVGKRKAGRINATSRKEARPLLSGAKA